MAQININVTKVLGDLDALIVKLDKVTTTVKGVATASTESFGIMSNAIKSVKTTTGQLQSELSALKKELDKVKRTANLYANAMEKVDKETKKASASTKKFGDAAKKTSVGMGSMIVGFRMLLGALGIAGVIALTGKAILSITNLTIKFQSLGYALDKISGGNWIENIDAMGFLIELNDKFGAKLSVTTERWLKFRAAAKNSGITLIETENIFRSVTKASAVLGLRTDELRGIYLALEQMLSKGKVTTEELRRQLGERLPGAMGIMADALGITMNQLDKMMKKGEVLSSVALPKFAVALEKAYGIEALKSVDNLATGVGKMSGAWDRFVLTISEGDSVISRAIGGTMELITKAINSLTNFLETYDQLARRTSEAVYGKSAREVISGRIEDRLREMGVLKETEKRLNGLLKIQKLITRSTAVGSDARMKALVEEGKAQKKLDDLRELKASEGVLHAQSRMNAEIEVYNKFKALIDKDQAELDALKSGAAEKRLGKLVGGLAPSTGSTLDELTSKEKERLKVLEEQLETNKASFTFSTQMIKEYNRLLEKGKPVITDDTDGTGRKREVKLAKPYVPNHEAQIIQLQEQIRLNKELADVEFSGSEQRKSIQEQTVIDMRIIANMQLEDALTANDAELKAELKKWNDKEDIFDEGSDKWNDQIKERNIAEKAAQDKHNAEEIKIAIKHRNNINEIKSYDRNTTRENVDKDFSNEGSLLAAEVQERVGAQEKLIALTAKGSSIEKRALQELDEIRLDFLNIEIQRQIDYRKKLIELSSDPTVKEMYQKQIDGLEETKETFKTLEEQLYTGQGAWENWATKTSEILGSIQGLGDSLFEARISQIDEEIAKNEEKYDRLLELAKGDEAETKIIERNKELRKKQLEEKKKKEQIKQAKFQKAIAIQQAVINTAVAVSAALTAGPGVGIALAVITAAIAAIELATIVATPIPSFAKGGEMKYDGKALINDGGNLEYVERDGSILTAKDSNAIVDLKKGDIIHKDYESLTKNSMLLSGLLGGELINQKDFEKMYVGIERSIEKGFTKAKINNRITVLNKIDSYRDKMQNWS